MASCRDNDDDDDGDDDDRDDYTSMMMMMTMSVGLLNAKAEWETFLSGAFCIMNLYYMCRAMGKLRLFFEHLVFASFFSGCFLFFV